MSRPVLACRNRVANFQMIGRNNKCLVCLVNVQIPLMTVTPSQFLNTVIQVI